MTVAEVLEVVDVVHQVVIVAEHQEVEVKDVVHQVVEAIDVEHQEAGVLQIHVVEEEKEDHLEIYITEDVAIDQVIAVDSIICKKNEKKEFN